MNETFVEPQDTDEVNIIQLDDGKNYVSLDDLITVVKFAKENVNRETNELIKEADDWNEVEEAKKEREIYNKISDDILFGLVDLNDVDTFNGN